MPLGSKKTPNLITLNAQIVTGIITPLGLSPEKQDFVDRELKWLFSAADNYMRLYQTVQQRLEVENKRLIRAFAGSPIANRKREQEMAQLRPQIWREEVAHSEAVAVPVPPEVEQISDANNRVRIESDDYKLQQAGEALTASLNLINTHLRQLELLGERERLQGSEAKSNLALQNQLKLERMAIVEELAKMADILHQIYGILITTPQHLMDYLE